MNADSIPSQLINKVCPIEMEYVFAASILYKLHMEITKDNIGNIIKSTGHSPDWTQIRMLIEYNMTRVEGFAETLTERSPIYVEMEYILAALLLHKLKEEITKDNIKNIIKSTGSTPNDLQVSELMAWVRQHQYDAFMKARLGLLRRKFNNTPAQGGTRIAITIDGQLNASLINAVRQMGVTKRNYVKEALIRRLIAGGYVKGVQEETCTPILNPRSSQHPINHRPIIQQTDYINCADNSDCTEQDEVI